MAISVTPNLTDISLCEAVGSWSAGTTSADYALQGTYALGIQVKATLSAVVSWAFGSPANMTGKHIYIWMMCTGKVDTIANGGFRIYVETDATHYGTWYVGGNDVTPGGWNCFIIDPASTPTSGLGTINPASITKVGVQFKTLTSALGTTLNCFWDACRYGSGLTITSGVADAITFENIYAIDNLDVDTVANFDIANFAYGVSSTASGRIQYVDTPNTRLYLCQVEGTFQTAENIVERATRTGSNLDGTATNDATTAEFNVIKGYNDIKAVFVQRKFTGGTSGGTWIVGETVTQAVSGWTGKFVAVVNNVLYAENTSGTPDNTNQLTGATGTYTPTATSAQTTVDKDLNNGAGAKPYNAVVDCAGRTVLQIYQYLKYITNHNSTSTINGDAGEEYRSAKETDSYTDCKQAPFGTFAGGTFFGARGIWIEDYAVASFSLIDANGDLQNPPNYQKVSVGHANLNGCQILVAERTGAAIIKDQYTIQSTTTTTITCTGNINANKCPQSGSLRVGDWKATYTSFSGAVFSGVSPDPSGKTGSLYVPQLDVLADATSEESDNIILTAAFDVKTRVRKYGYKDYTMDTSFPTTGLAITPILATDPQAS